MYSSKTLWHKMDIMIYYSLLRYCTVLKLATPLPCDQYGYSLLRYCTVLKPKDPKIIFI